MLASAGANPHNPPVATVSPIASSTTGQLTAISSSRGTISTRLALAT